MSIVFSRIDDRLIHGQVVTTWSNMYSVEQIIILNDKIAGDKTQKNILKMAAPSGIKVQAFPVEKFGQIIQTNEITRRTMLLFTTSEDVLRAINAGVPVENLNVGGMRFQTGREKLTKAVSVTPDERQAFKEILDKNIEVTVQMVPNDEKVYLSEVI